MTPQEQDDVVKQIWEDVQLAKTLAQAPELLAHYTSMEALEKILQSKTFMFSNPHFMSDRYNRAATFITSQLPLDSKIFPLRRR